MAVSHELVEGANATSMLHELPGDISAPETHVVFPVTVKSAALKPMIVGAAEMVSGAFPVLATVNVTGLLVVFTLCSGKLIKGGVMLAVGACWETWPVHTKKGNGKESEMFPEELHCRVPQVKTSK